MKAQSTDGGRRRKRRASAATDAGSSASRQRLLDEAIREFAERGFAGARMDEIAERAGLNKQLLYYYFGDKKAVYEAALMQATARQRTLWHQTEGVDYVERLIRFGAKIAEPDAAAWNRMILWEALQEMGNGDGADTEQLLYGLDEVRAAQEEGYLDPDLDTDMLTLALTTLLQIPHTFPRLTKRVTGRAPSDTEFRERYSAFVQQLLRGRP